MSKWTETTWCELETDFHQLEGGETMRGDRRTHDGRSKANVSWLDGIVVGPCTSEAGSPCQAACIWQMD